MRSTVRVKKALPYTYAQPEATPPASIPGSKFNRQGGSKFNRRRHPGALALEAYVRFLLVVGKASLPGALNLIHAKHGAQLEAVLKQSRSARTVMDQLVSRLMLEDLPALQAPGLRGATLAVLDALVQAGSSNAFLLREDFVTPTGGVGR